MRKVLQSALTAENKIILIKCCDLLLKVCLNQAKTRMTIESLSIGTLFQHVINQYYDNLASSFCIQSDQAYLKNFL